MVRRFDQGLEQCQRMLAADRSAARAAESAAKEREARPAEPPKPARETGKIRNPLLFERLETKIMTFEGDIEAVQASMLDPDNYASASKMKQLQAKEVQLKAELAEAYAEWENWQ